jgi:hypothetical protein
VTFSEAAGRRDDAQPIRRPGASRSLGVRNRLVVSQIAAAARSARTGVGRVTREAVVSGPAASAVRAFGAFDQTLSCCAAERGTQPGVELRTAAGDAGHARRSPSIRSRHPSPSDAVLIA